MVVSLERLLLAVPINMALTILAAYPLSKSARRFRSRTVYVWIIFFTMLFSGGLIWALVLPPPFGVPVFTPSRAAIGPSWGGSTSPPRWRRWPR